MLSKYGAKEANQLNMYTDDTNFREQNTLNDVVRKRRFSFNNKERRPSAKTQKAQLPFLDQGKSKLSQLQMKL